MVGSGLHEFKPDCSELAMNLAVGRSIDANNDALPLPDNSTQVSDSSDISNHLERMSLADDGGGCVPISVGGETFFAHPVVLTARSPFLEDQLLSKAADATKTMDGGITLPGIEPETFRVLLQFMYTGTLPGEEELTTESLQRLIAAADMLRMDEMKTTCAQKLWERVSPETVAVTLCCAEAHSCSELKARCIDFFFSPAENFKTAAMTEGYFQIIKFFPWVFDELKHEWGLRKVKRESNSTL